MIKGKMPYFRSRIPARLSHRMDRNEIRIPVRTTDLQKASAICRLLQRQMNRICDIMEKENHSFTYDELRAKLDEVANLLLSSIESWTFDYIHSNHNTPKDREEVARGIDSFINDARRSLAESDCTLAQCDFLTMGPPELQNVSSIGLLDSLAKEYYQKKIYVLEVAKEHLQGNYDTEYDRRKGTATVDPHVTLQARAIDESPIPTPASAPEVSFSRLIEQFIAFKASSGEWKAKTRVSRQASLHLLVEYFGEECDPAAITASQMLDFREKVLRKLPVRRNVSPEYRNKSLKDLLELDHIKTMDIATINDYLMVCSSFFQWGIRFHDWKSNPVSGLLISDQRSDDAKRVPYTQTEIETIFRNWVTFPDNTPARKARKEQFGWILLIAAHSGMRENEICQLFVSDIVCSNGIPCFDLQENHPTKSLKNRQSRRQVPIHAQLLKHGFLTFVNRQRELPEKIICEGTPPVRQLFPCCLWDKNNHYGRNFSRAYAAFSQSILPDTQARFHSFRHNVATCLNNLDGISSHHVSRILGHAQQTTTERIYTKTDLKVLSGIINRMHYNVDPFELLKMPALTDAAVQEQIALLPVKG